MGTYGNGFRIIGMTITMVHLQMEVLEKMEIASSVSFAVAAGSTVPGNSR